MSYHCLDRLARAAVGRDNLGAAEPLPPHHPTRAAPACRKCRCAPACLPLHSPMTTARPPPQPPWCNHGHTPRSPHRPAHRQNQGSSSSTKSHSSCNVTCGIPHASSARCLDRAQSSNRLRVDFARSGMKICIPNTQQMKHCAPRRKGGCWQCKCPFANSPEGSRRWAEDLR